MKILILEPNAEKGLIFQKKLTEFWKEYKNKYSIEYDIEFIYLGGTNNEKIYHIFGNGYDEYNFYNEEIYCQLKQIISSQDKFGILMNPILTREEEEFANREDYDNLPPLLSLKLWDTYKDVLSIYFVTDHSILFSKFLKEEFWNIWIHSDIITKFHMEAMLKKIFDYYVNQVTSKDESTEEKINIGDDCYQKKIGNVI